MTKGEIVAIGTACGAIGAAAGVFLLKLGQYLRGRTDDNIRQQKADLEAEKVRAKLKLDSDKAKLTQAQAQAEKAMAQAQKTIEWQEKQIAKRDADIALRDQLIAECRLALNRCVEEHSGTREDMAIIYGNTKYLWSVCDQQNRILEGLGEATFQLEPLAPLPDRRPRDPSQRSDFLRNQAEQAIVLAKEVERREGEKTGGEDGEGADRR